MPKIKNIIIFTAVAAVFVLIYIFFIKKDTDEATLVSSPSTPTPVAAVSGGEPVVDASVTSDFLALLLSVKNIRLDDAIFADKAFESLRDSSITLVPDGNEGRPNPFAEIGSDSIAPPPLPETTSPAPFN